MKITPEYIKAMGKIGADMARRDYRAEGAFFHYKMFNINCLIRLGYEKEVMLIKQEEEVSSTYGP